MAHREEGGEGVKNEKQNGLACVVGDVPRKTRDYNTKQRLRAGECCGSGSGEHQQRRKFFSGKLVKM